MVISNRPLHAFLSGVFAVLLLALTAAAQDKPSGAPSLSDATAFSILNLLRQARADDQGARGSSHHGQS
jgi:hypothetical protein